MSRIEFRKDHHFQMKKGEKRKRDRTCRVGKVDQKFDVIGEERTLKRLDDIGKMYEILSLTQMAQLHLKDLNQFKYLPRGNGVYHTLYDYYKNTAAAVVYRISIFYECCNWKISVYVKQKHHLRRRREADDIRDPKCTTTTQGTTKITRAITYAPTTCTCTCSTTTTSSTTKGTTTTVTPTKTTTTKATTTRKNEKTTQGTTMNTTPVTATTRPTSQPTSVTNTPTTTSSTSISTASKKTTASAATTTTPKKPTTPMKTTKMKRTKRKKTGGTKCSLALHAPVGGGSVFQEKLFQCFRTPIRQKSSS